jgi:hypothetical protein
VSGVPITIPANTRISVALLDSLSSKQCKAGQPVHFTLAEDMVDQNGNVLVKKGPLIDGQITAVEKPDMFHSRGLIGFKLTTMHVNGADIPVNVAETDAKFHDFRTRDSIAAKTPSTTETATFYNDQSYAAADLVAQSGDAVQQTQSRTAGSSSSSKSSTGDPTIFQDPLEESGAVILSQILDFNKSQALLKGLADTNLAHVAQAFVTGNNLKMYTNKFSSSGFVSMVGAGIGLYHLLDVSKGFQQHVQLAPGSVFNGYIGKDTQVEITPDPSKKRGPIFTHPHFMSPMMSARQNHVFHFQRS